MKTFLGKILMVALGVLVPSLQAQPVITSQPATQPVVWGGNATFSVMATGPGPFTYQWRLNGTNLPLNGIINTVVGGGATYGVPANAVSLTNPSGMAADAAGNLFIADAGDNLVLKLSTNGVITTVAGNGVPAWTGDGGVATSASLNAPLGVAVDAAGNLFIADTDNTCIRKVDTNGVITTVAGSGWLIWFFGGSFSGDDGAATNARVGYPSGVAVDVIGDLFIADTGNNRIRKVDTNGIINTVAGNGTNGYAGDGGAATSARLSQPGCLALDANGNLFIADAGNRRVRMLGTNGVINTVAGGGSGGDGEAATNASLVGPTSVAVDGAGNLLIVDGGFLREVGSNGIIATAAGNGTNGYSGDGGAATNASLNGPFGVAVDATGNLFISDQNNHCLRQVDTSGVITTLVGTGTGDNGGVAAYAGFNGPLGLAVDAAGNLFIADTGNNRVRKVDTNGVITTLAGNGTNGFSGDGGLATNASLNGPSSVAVDATGNVFITDYGNNRIREVGANGVITTVAGNGGIEDFTDYYILGAVATNVGLAELNGVAVDAGGNLLFADSHQMCIRKVSTNGIMTTVAGEQYFADNDSEDILYPGYYCLSFRGGYFGDGGPAFNATLNGPAGVAVDAAGDLFFADSYNQRIREVTTNSVNVKILNQYFQKGGQVITSGIITTVAGDGTEGYSGDGGAATSASLDYPFGVAVDTAGNLFIEDHFQQRIREVGANGTITTVAGNGSWGYSGDGGAATNASLAVFAGGDATYLFNSLAVDAAGNLFIADSNNNRIRKVTYSRANLLANGSLVLNHVSPADAGNYSVIITSASGSVTSSVVNLNLQLPPLAPVFTASNGRYSFTWSAVSNQTYQLQCATNLAAPVWRDLGSPVTATSNAVSASDTVGADGERFYRVRLWP